jgi:hypothetical protein
MASLTSLIQPTFLSTTAVPEPNKHYAQDDNSGMNNSNNTDDLFTVMYCPTNLNPISLSDVHATMSKIYSRQTHPDPNIRQSIQLVWDKRKAKNPTLFNGTKFRLASVDINQDGFPHLNMSITDYSAYLGTNWNKKLHQMYNGCAGDGQGIERCYLSDTLGVGGIVVTKDNYIVLIKRGENVAEYPAYLDIPGGHPEPSKVAGCQSSAWEYNEDDDSKFINENINMRDVVKELFQSVIEEIYEEVNIPRNNLLDLKLLFIMRQTEPLGKPSATFQLNCNLTSIEIQQYYNQGPEDASETEGLVMVEVEKIRCMNVSEMRLEMTPATIGSLILWKKFNPL